MVNKDGRKSSTHNLRDHPLEVARSTNKSEDVANFKTTRSKAVGVLRSAKLDFYHSVFEDSKNSAKEIWKTI